MASRSVDKIIFSHKAVLIGNSMSRSSTVANSRVLISNRGLVIKCSSGIGKVTTTTAKKPELTKKFLDQYIIGTVCYLQAGLHSIK